MKKILVILPLEENERSRFREQVNGAPEDYLFSFYPSLNDVPAEEVSAANIIIGQFSATRAGEAENLEWLHGSMAGIDSFLAPGVLPENVLLTNSAGAYGPAVSEHMVAATLALVRRFPQYMRNQTARVWKPEGNIICIEGSTVAVLGLGDIGGHYAKKMKALGAYVIGIRRTDKDKPEYVDEQYTVDRLPEVIGRADIVAMVLPGSKETEKLMNEDLLYRMKPGSYLVNDGRGSAVDLDALKKVLDDGHIAGAALDVTDPEPLPADHPLWDYKNVLLTPHVSGGFFLRRTLDNVISIACKNLRLYTHGGQMEHVVDRSAGY